MAPELDLPFKLLRPKIGAEVLLDKDALLSGLHSSALRQLLEARGVLLFPGVGFDENEQIEFTKTLGNYVPDRADGAATPISIDPAGGRTASYTRSAFFWHFDGYMNEVPILASLLCCEVPSATGGRTEFCSTYSAYEELPDSRKAQIKRLRAVHAMARSQMSVEPEPNYETFHEWLGVSHRELPLVWEHRSGRKSLVVGNTALAIIGVHPLDGLDLLVWLRDWATQPQFAYSHSWSPGDAVLWDNTGTLHRATPYDEAGGRRMRRTKLAGEEPLK